MVLAVLIGLSYRPQVLFFYAPLAVAANLLLEGVRCGLDMKLARMGHTKRISHSPF